MGQTLTDIIDRFDSWRSKPTVAAKERSGVLLVSSGGIGDTLLFRLMVQRFQILLRENEQLHLVIRDDSSHVAFLFPKDIQIHTVDYPRFLKNRPYRRAVCERMLALNLRVAGSTDHLRHPLIDDVIVRATFAPRKFALKPRSWPKYDAMLHRNSKQYDPLIEVPDQMEHRLIRWWHLANAICDDVQAVPVATLPKEILPTPPRLGRDLFMLHPFSAIKERQYNVRVFQEILKVLPLDCDIALSCGPEDLTNNPEFKILLDDDRVYADANSFEDKAATLQATKLVVSVDTSLMHLAILCGSPTICLATAAHVVDSIPYDERMIPANVFFLYHDMKCRMCLGQCSLPLEDNRYPCIARLETPIILDKITDVLSASTP